MSLVRPSDRSRSNKENWRKPIDALMPYMKLNEQMNARRRKFENYTSVGPLCQRTVELNPPQVQKQCLMKSKHLNAKNHLKQSSTIKSTEKEEEDTFGSNHWKQSMTSGLRSLLQDLHLPDSKGKEKLEAGMSRRESSISPSQLRLNLPLSSSDSETKEGQMKKSKERSTVRRSKSQSAVGSQYVAKTKETVAVKPPVSNSQENRKQLSNEKQKSRSNLADGIFKVTEGSLRGGADSRKPRTINKASTQNYVCKQRSHSVSSSCSSSSSSASSSESEDESEESESESQEEEDDDDDDDDDDSDEAAVVENIDSEDMDDLITIYINGTTFETSRDLLMKQSGLFRELLMSNENKRTPNVVTLRGLNTEAFDVALQWMEGFHKVIITKDNVQPIHKLAKRLQIPELELKCRRIIGNQGVHIRGGASAPAPASEGTQPPPAEQPTTNGKGEPAPPPPTKEEGKEEKKEEKKEDEIAPELITEEIFGDIVELPEPPDIPPHRAIVQKREGELELKRNYILARQPDVHVIEREIPEPEGPAPPPSSKKKKAMKIKKVKGKGKQKKEKKKKGKKDKKKEKPGAVGIPCENLGSDLVNRCRPCGTTIYWDIDPECILHQQLLRTREGSELPLVFPRAASVPSETNLFHSQNKTFRTRQLPVTGPLSRRQPDRVVRIIVGDVTFPVDRNRLIKHSRRLSCMLQTHREVVPESLVIRGVTVEGFQEVAHWLNGDCMELTPCNILMIAEVARRLDMPELINTCQSYLDSVNKGEKLQKIVPYYPDYDTNEFLDPPPHDNTCSLQQACPPQMEERMEASGNKHKRRLPFIQQPLSKRTKGSGDDEEDDDDDDDDETTESEEPSTDEEKPIKKEVRAIKSETNLAMQLKDKLWNTIKGQFYRTPTDTKNTVKTKDVSKIRKSSDAIEQQIKSGRPVSGRERSYLCPKEQCRNTKEQLAKILTNLSCAKRICFGESFCGSPSKDSCKTPHKKDVVRLPFDFRDYHWVIEVTKPICHSFCAAVLVEGNLYVSGGRMVNGGDSSPEAVTNIWSFNIQSMEWHHVAYMNYARIHHSVVAISKEIFYIGGVDEKLRILQSVDVFDITTGNVCQLLPMSVPRAGASAAYYNSYLWVCGGLVEPSHLNCSCLVTTVERFNFEYNSWETVRSLRIPRAFGTLIEYRGQLLLVGGVAANTKKSSSGCLVACEEVDVLTSRQNMWCLHSKLLQARHCATLVVSGNDLYVLGGISLRTETMISSIEKYEYKQHRWKRVDNDFITG